MEKIIKVEGMHCAHCSARVEKALTELGYGVEVMLENGEVKVKKDSINDKEVVNAIEELGFIVK